MRALLTATILGGVLVLSASGVAAQENHRSNPYAGLFTGQIVTSPENAPAPSERPRYRIPFVVSPTPGSLPSPSTMVVCGLTIVQGDARLDPAMSHQPPANASTPSIKIVPAPACQK